MARFRGTVKGGRGEASRLGHASSGLFVKAAGWRGSVTVCLGVKDGIDMVTVMLHTDDGGSVCLYGGTLDKYDNPRKVELIKLFDRNDPTE